MKNTAQENQEQNPESTNQDLNHSHSNSNASKPKEKMGERDYIKRLRGVWVEKKAGQAFSMPFHKPKQGTTSSSDKKG